MLKKLAPLLALVSLTVLAVQAGPDSVRADDKLTLTILHSNDASSLLLNAGHGLEDYGGAARFKALVDAERSRGSLGANTATIVVSAGPTLHVGPNLAASVEKGAPYFDAIAMLGVGYDAAVFGHQDFDLGPDVLAGFLCGIVMSGGGFDFPGCGVTGRSAFPFLAANLDFAGEPRLQEFVDAGGIARSTVVMKGEHRIGVVGVVTPMLGVISSPRNVTVDSNYAPVVQAEIDALQARDINKIIVLAQLESISEVESLAKALSGVDVIVAGGTGEALSRADGPFLPGDAYTPGRAYPLRAAAADGNDVLIVTTGGGYNYLGRLVVEFDSKGKIAWVDHGSGPLMVAGPGLPGGVSPDLILSLAIDRPLQAFLEGLRRDIVAISVVALEGRRDIIRTRETNLGNLMADAALWQARELAGSYGVASPTVAILNAGGMRLEELRAAGPLTRLETFEIAPFASFISVVENFKPADFKLIMENSLSRLPATDGRFGQIAGFKVVFSPAGKALAFDNNGALVDRGSRVLSIQLDDGRYIVRDGSVVPGAPSVTIATIDFMARGGDQYPFPGPFSTLGVTYQQALEAYLTQVLGGVISASQYPEGGSGRITVR